MQVCRVFVEIGHALTDFLFPPACILCGAGLTGHEKLCGNCQDTVFISALRYEPPQKTLENVSAITVLLP
ncbi:MAG: double zinc ribbon domain-containing protein, partial [Candidatus Latescibacterota bacterium]